MDKKTLIGLIVVGLLFVGFMIYNGKQQEEYQEKMAAWQAEQDSIAAAHAPVLPFAAADSTGVAGLTGAELASGEALPVAGEAQEAYSMEAILGAELAAAAEADAEEFTIENEVLAVRFSTRGGQIVGVTLKDYTQYAEGERTELVSLFDPATARFNLNLFIRRGLNNLPVNTMDYTFGQKEVTKGADGSQVVTMQLNLSEQSAIRYRYTLHNTAEAAEDYLLDFDVQLIDLAPLMSNQTSIKIDWSNTSYQNERGFKNENMYTTLSYRFPDEESIEDLGMGSGTQSKEIAASVNWVAFKQQYFSSVFIAKNNAEAKTLSFETMQPGSGYIKHFNANFSVPYTPQTESYAFGFYFGPNKYSILRKVDREGFGDLYLERLVPLGWGIIGWVNRWGVIPVFDFLRNYTSNFGFIILILVILVKLVVSPITYRSYVSMAKMRLLRPQIEEINKKFPKREDAMKRQQATMELQRKAGVSALGGCVPMLLQLPILYALFRFFPSSIELRGESFLWSHDLSSYDSVLELPFSIPFYGDHVSLFALLMALSTFGFSYYSYQQSASSQPQMAGMKFMMLYLMPLMMLCWFNDYASGLCYYYLLFNIFTIAQTLITRRLVSDDKIRALMAEYAAKKSKGKKSRFQLRYEELLRQQQEAAQRNRK